HLAIPSFPTRRSSDLHLLEGRRDDRVVALVKEEDGHAVEAELAGELAEPVDILLHRVADKDEGVDPLLFRLGEGMGEDPLNLGLDRKSTRLNSSHRTI